MTIQILTALAALIPALLANLTIARDVNRHPIPTEWACEIAYREGRQCTNGVGIWSTPERCALPEDHYGECVS